MKLKPIYIYLIGFFVIVLAVVLLNTGDKKTTVQLEQKTIPHDEVHKNIDPNEDSPAMSNLKSDIIERMQAMKERIEADPTDTLTRKEYADLLHAGHRQEDALALYNKILDIDPNRIDILTRLTYNYYNAGDIQKSEEANNKILRIDSDNHFANYNVGAIAIARGDTSGAKRIWNDVIIKYPETEVAEFARKALDRLNK